MNDTLLIRCAERAAMYWSGRLDVHGKRYPVDPRPEWELHAPLPWITRK